MADITIDRVVERYMGTRKEISELEGQIKKLKETQGKRESWLAGELERLQLKNAKTDHGTVMKVVKESVTVDDWDATLDWVKTGHWEYLNRAISKAVVLEHMGEGRENTPPPGISYSAFRTVAIRKS